MTDDAEDGDRLRLNLFTMNAVEHVSVGSWRLPGDQSHRYRDQAYWTDVARTAERGGFDAVFFADVRGIYDVYGDDRETAVDVTDIYLDENDHGEREVVVEYDAELTQKLPAKWDVSDMPRTEREAKAERRNKWLRRCAKLAPLAVTGVVVFGVTSLAFPAISRVSMEVSETTTAPSFMDVMPSVALVFIIAAVIVYGLSGGLPGTVRGGRP